MDEWLNILWYACTKRYYLSIKKKKKERIRDTANDLNEFQKTMLNEKANFKRLCAI